MVRTKMTMVLLALILAAPAYAQELKIGVVDMQRALNQTDEGKRELKKLEGKLAKEKQIMQQKQDELKALSDDLNNKGFMYSESKRAEMEEKLRMMSRDLERYQKDKKEEFVRRQRNSTARIIKGLIKILGDYAKAEKFDLILESSGQVPGSPGVVVFSSSKVNITKKIIELYNRQSNEESKK